MPIHSRWFGFSAGNSPLPPASTENIFPVIKKFLYSDHEIFLRELVSNAVDATQKLKTFEHIDEMLRTQRKEYTLFRVEGGTLF